MIEQQYFTETFGITQDLLVEARAWIEIVCDIQSFFLRYPKHTLPQINKLVHTMTASQADLFISAQVVPLLKPVLNEERDFLLCLIEGLQQIALGAKVPDSARSFLQLEPFQDSETDSVQSDNKLVHRID